MKWSKPAFTPVRLNASKCMESRCVYHKKSNNGGSHFSHILKIKESFTSLILNALSISLYWLAPCLQNTLILLVSQVLKPPPFTVSTTFWSKVEKLDCSFPALSLTNLDKWTTWFYDKAKADFQRNKLRSSCAFENQDKCLIAEPKSRLKKIFPILLLHSTSTVSLSELVTLDLHPAKYVLIKALKNLLIKCRSRHVVIFIYFIFIFNTTNGFFFFLNEWTSLVIWWKVCNIIMHEKPKLKLTIHSP